MTRISLNKFIPSETFLLFLIFFTAFAAFLVAANNEIFDISKNRQKNNLLVENHVNENAVEQFHSNKKLDEQMTFNNYDYYAYGHLMARAGRVRRSDGEYKRRMDRDMERQREGQRKSSHDRPNSNNRHRSGGREKSHGSRQKQGESSRRLAQRSSYRRSSSSGGKRRGLHGERRGDADESSRNRRDRSSEGRRQKSSERRKSHLRKSSSSPGERLHHHQQSRHSGSSNSRRSGGGRPSSHNRRRSSTSAVKEVEHKHRYSPCKQIKKMCGFGKSRMNVNIMREMHEFGERYCVARERFARGGQGEIFVAYSKKYGKCAAYKLVKLESMPNQGMRSSALNESKVINHLRKVNDRRPEGNKLKRIIRIYENEQRGKSIHTIMDLGETDLYSYYKEKMSNLEGEKKRREIECLIAGILNAMIELHGAGVMHLDFKLENAILMPSDLNANVKSVKIIDFGAARIVPSYFSLSRNINESVRIMDRIYTTIYAAPEYAMLNYVNTKADIWSIGVIIGELLTNEDINVNKIVLLERKDSRLAFPKMPFNTYTHHVYRRLEQLRGMLVKYLNNANNDRFWRLALGCLRFESNVRPMALQLLAYMNDWCILGVPSTFAKVMEEKSYSGHRKYLPMCSDINDVDYAEKVSSRKHSGGTSSRPASSSSSLQRKSGGGGGRRHISGSRPKSGGSKRRGLKGIFSFFTF